MVSNGDCVDSPSFEIGVTADTGTTMSAYGAVETSTGNTGTDTVTGVGVRL